MTQRAVLFNLSFEESSHSHFADRDRSPVAALLGGLWRQQGFCGISKPGPLLRAETSRGSGQNETARKDFFWAHPYTATNGQERGQPCPRGSGMRRPNTARTPRSALREWTEAGGAMVFDFENSVSGFRHAAVTHQVLKLEHPDKPMTALISRSGTYGLIAVTAEQAAGDQP